MTGDRLFAERVGICFERQLCYRQMTTDIVCWCLAVGFEDL